MVLVTGNGIGDLRGYEEGTHESLRRANDSNGHCPGSEDRRSDDDGEMHDEGRSRSKFRES